MAGKVGKGAKGDAVTVEGAPLGLAGPGLKLA